MLSQVHSFVLQGIEPVSCEVEVDVADRGLPKTTIVGLPDAAVKESIERVRSAMVNSGFAFPMSRMLINLAPAEVKKEGPIFDLPIAVGLLLAESAIQTQRHRRLLFAGELALDGRLRPVRGVINLALLCKREGLDGVVVPVENAEEAAAVDVPVFPADSLTTVVAFLNDRAELEGPAAASLEEAVEGNGFPVDFADIRGQESVKRALTVAAAGAHNAVMIGPAGTGKSLSAKALPSILPPLSRDEALEVTRIYSAVGQVPAGTSLITTRPVRTPHHTASPVAVIGGGAIPKPGEVSLAHHGVLFLDEMPEFPRAVLETLRQPLEDGHVTIARAQSSLRFPARFMLLAAMNPTPKGDSPTPGDDVSQRQMEKYLSKLSGPLIDRIDIHVEVPPVPYQQLSAARSGTDSKTMRDRVLAARRRRAERIGDSTTPNAALSGRQLDELAPMSESAKRLLKEAMTSLGLSARAYDKVRRVARTIADLADADALEADHVAEAVQYRVLDRSL